MASSPIEHLPTSDVRHAAERMVGAWGFGAAFTYLSSGAIFASFARALGANDFLFAVLDSAVPLMNVFQVLATRLVEGTHRRKLQLVISGVIGRALWIVIALLPFLHRVYPNLISREKVLFALVVCVLLSGALQSFGNPAFFSWINDLFPRRAMPMFLAKRTQLGTYVTLCAALISGIIADAMPRLEIYGLLLAAGGILGLMEIIAYLRVREPRRKHSAPPASVFSVGSMWEEIKAPLRERTARRFLLFNAIYLASISITSPILWLYFLEYLHLSKTLAGILVVALPNMVMGLSVPFWGITLRRFGNKPVIQICTFIQIFIPFAYIIARPGAWDLVPLAVLLAGLCQGAVRLSIQNITTGVAPQIPRSAMAASFAATGSISMTASAWIGGALAEGFLWMNHPTIHLFSLRIINYHIVFLVSIIICIINWMWITPHLREPSARGTLETMQTVMPEIAEVLTVRLSRRVGKHHPPLPR
jgi:MFS family permease